MNKRDLRKMRQGFTLVELLIVIAIIALLGTILSPVFARARENARRTACQSNMKQLGLAVSQYAQDHDEMMPPTDLPPFGSVPPIYALERIGPYVKNDQIFRCPSDPTKEDNPTASRILSSSGTSTILSSYFPTVDLSAPPGTDAYWGVFGYQKSISLADIPVPTETIAIADQAGASDPTGAVNPGGIGRGGATPTTDAFNIAVGEVSMRHLEGANYLFADGHVKWFKRRRASSDQTGANARINGVYFYYFWRKGVAGK